MSFLQDLHGTVAAVLICTLLLIDEAGVPVPIAPSEVVLVVTGVLIAGGAFPLWGMIPALFLAMLLGMIAGYGWAKTLGQDGLAALAERVHAVDVYNRAQTRLRGARPLGIAVSRMVPGIRPYATLISGAAEVDPRTFLAGAVPALLVWEILWLLVGMLVGLPVAHFLSAFEELALRGAVLIILGVVIWLAVRQSSERRSGFARVAPRLRACLALLVDAGIVIGLVAGSFAVGSWALHRDPSAPIELVVAAVLLAGLLIAGRGIQTPGEAIFDTHYWHHQ